MRSARAELKACTACGEAKPLDEFSLKGPSRPGQRISYCKPCNSEKSNAYNKAKLDERSAYMRKWRAENIQHVRDVAFKRRYPGFDRDAALAAQGGGCAICGTTDPGKRGWAVDHDHACCPDGGYRTCGGCVRGVLCNGCNVGLGHFRENESVMLRAIEYLKNAGQKAK